MSFSISPHGGHEVLPVVNNGAAIWEHSRGIKRAIVAIIAIPILASSASVIVRFIFLPIGVDGGLYSYPALSLSRGGDPGESQLSVEELEGIQGIKAVFGYDLSRTTRVIPMAWWIGAFGGTIWSLKVFGITEMLLLFTIMLFALLKSTKTLLIALLLWSIYLTDSTVLALGSTDLRPDIMLAVLTLLVFLLLDVRPEKIGKGLLLLMLAVLTMLLLAVTHVTAAISLAFLTCYMIVQMIFAWHSIPKFTKYLYVSLIITGGLGFLFRRSICAFLVPTQYLHRIGSNTVVDVEKGALQLLAGGLLPLVEKESSRWVSYFYPYNLPLLFVIVIALLLFVANAIDSSKENRWSSEKSLLAGLIGGLGVLALDPHPWGAHAIPLVPLFIIFLAKEIDITHNTQLKCGVIYALLVLALASAGAQTAYAAKATSESTRYGFTNSALVGLMKHVFQDDKHHLVVGPTEIWPYIDSRASVTIFDAKIVKLDEISKYFRKVDYFIIDKDYKGYDWEKRFRQLYPNVTLETVSQLGDENSGWPFVKIMNPIIQ